MELVESSNHTYLIADAPFGFSQIHIPPHAHRSERLHGIGLHVSNIFKDRHHTPTRMIRNSLARLVGSLYQFRIIGSHKFTK